MVSATTSHLKRIINVLKECNGAKFSTINNLSGIHNIEKLKDGLCFLKTFGIIKLKTTKSSIKRYYLIKKP